MLKKVKKYIKENNLIKPNSTVLVAVSGGPDSVALLDILYNLRTQLGYRLIVAHYNHKMRPESEKDEIFVLKLVEKYQLELVVDRAKSDIDSEEQAREARYNFFERVLKDKEINYLALAQNKSDQVETILFNLIRGAGLNGLSGIRSKRKFNNHYLIRPLLCLSREEIVRYLKNNDLKFVVDRTNLEIDYTRNKIRHQIIPALKKLNPNLENSLNNQRELIRNISDHLNKSSRAFIESRVKINNCIATMDQKKYLKLDVASRSNLLLLIITKIANLKDISFEHLKEVEEIFKQTSSDKKVKAFKGLKFSKRAGNIRIEKVDKEDN